MSASLPSARATQSDGKIEESIESHGKASSYYYWTDQKAAPRVIPAAISAEPVSEDLDTVIPITISSYSWLDDGSVVKVFVPFQGAKSLPAEAIRCHFERDVAELRVVSEGKVNQLRLANLYYSIDPEKSKWRTSNERITLVLAKKDANDMVGRWDNLCRGSGR